MEIGRHRAKKRRRNEDSPKAILNRLTGHIPCAANGYASLASVDSMKDFVAQLARLSPSRSYIVVVENAEGVRDMDLNVLPMLLRLPEVTGLNCVLLVSDLPFEKYFVRTGLAPVVKLFEAEYSKKDILVILMTDFEAVRGKLRIELESCIWLRSSASTSNANRRDGTIAADDLTRLWQNISKTMKLALGTIYMRIGNINQKLLRPITVDGQTSPESVEQMQTMKRLAQNLELPFYAKFLLIAAYLASHNAAKEAKRETTQKKRLQSVNAKVKVSEKMATQLGPKAFTIDRLLAIFYDILDEKVGLTCNLLAQISTLIHLKFLNFASGEGTIMDGSARLQCTV
ncbi:origin recognition complex subunit 5 [Culex quinquefasciatus]|uniref:Origin recognition complex subunit 5 n=1 Tax=Culex quinquefasciatus TaxID=7176 RepID=B0X440_CULQU|nr:origin recognition complex subunit 5 [Culex quinquefasciatus]|eukprot:XP_001864412.1 origin recognition complex subunit 5 [Culex quinquefasciatus]